MGRWFNLVFMGLGALGLGVWALGRSRNRDRFLPTAALAGTCVVGLTLTGAIHDLGLGPPGSYFHWILPAAVLVGSGAAWLLWKARMRWFPPVEGVKINPPDQVGALGRVVSSTVTGDPGSGRAQWRTSEGVIILVRCHTAGSELTFGDEVTLEEFDDESRSYRVVAH